MELRRRLRVRAVVALATVAQAVTIVFGVVTLLQGAPAAAVASVPYLINFQGRLTDNSGNVLADGSYNIKFRIYDALSGGTNRWEGDRVRGAADNRITVTNGLFNIQFGDTSKGDPALSPSLFNSQTYAGLYLEVELPTPASATCSTNGCAVFTEGAMTPRQPLASSPYAFNSDTLDGLDSSAFVQLSPSGQQTGSINVSGNIQTAAALQGATATLSGASSLTVGTASSASGAVIFKSAGSTNTVTLTVGATAASYSLNLPLNTPNTSECLKTDPVTATQLVFGACSAASGANAALSNLASVAINTSLLPGVTNSIDAGSSSFTFRSGYFGTSVLTPGVDTLSAGALTLGGTTATSISLAQNATVAAGKSLTITGSGSRPGSPTAGMLYFDTSTSQLLQYNGTKWVAARSTSTKIVAANNSSQAVKDSADYVAPGSGDESTINTALTAAAGGSVYLMEGTYNVAASISVPNNTTLAGAGAGTLITIPNAQNGSYPIITNTDTATGTRVYIRDLRLDGNGTNQASGNMGGIYFTRVGSGSGSSAIDGGKINNVVIRNLLGGSSYGIYLNLSHNTTVAGNTIVGSSGYGIFINTGDNNNITGNVLEGNAYGINNAGNYSIIANNTVQGGSYGIYSSFGSDATITGNIISSSAFKGVYLSFSPRSVVTGNRIIDSGGSTGNDAIETSSTDSSTITGNQITDSSCTVTCYALKISGNSNYLSNNTHSGTAANPSSISDTGTGTVFANQPDGSGNLINRSQGGGLTVGASSATSTLTLQGGLSATALPAPTLSATVTNAGTAGTTTYRYQVTAKDGLGETTGSTIQQTTTGNATLSSTNFNTISWTPVGGAIGYKIYRCTGASCTPGYITSVSGSVTGYSDTAPGTPGVIAPVMNGTGGANLAGGLQMAGTTVITSARQLQNILTVSVSTGNTFQFLNSSAQSLLSVDTSASQTVLGLAGASGVNGKLVFGTATAGSYTIGLQASSAQTASYTLTLPTAAPGVSQCLKTDAAVATTLTFASCGSSSVSLQTAYDTGSTITLSSNTLTVRDAASPLASAFSVKSNDGTVTYFDIASSGLKVYDSSNNANYAMLTSSGGAAVLSSSTGVVQIGQSSGNVNVSLSGAADRFQYSKTYTAGAAYSTDEFGVSRSVTGGANTLTGSLLKVEDLSTGTGVQSTLLTLNQSNSAATGYLFRARTASVDKLTVDPSGNVFAAGSLALGNTGNANLVTLAAPSGASAYSLKLPSAAGSTSQCLQTSAGDATQLAFGSCGSAGSPTTLQNAYDNSSPAQFLLADAKNLTITSPDTATDSNVVMNFQCTVSCSAGGGALSVQHNGTAVFSVNQNTSASSAFLFHPTVDSSVAFQVQDSSSTALLTADTTNTLVKIGTTTTATLANVRLLVTLAEVTDTLRIGDATNGFEVSKASGPLYRGTARPTRRIMMSPEFAGAVIRPDGTNNTGTMTTAYEAATGHNYYSWTTTQGTSQDYDVTVRVPVPMDYSALPATPQVCFYGYSTNTTNSTLALSMLDTANAAVTLSSSSYTPGSASAWAETCRTISGTPTITAGGFLTLRMTMAALSSSQTRLGEFRIDYLAKF